METASAGGELTSTQTTSRTVAASLGATGQGARVTELSRQAWGGLVTMAWPSRGGEVQSWPDEGLPPAWPPPQRVPCHKVSGTGSTIFIAQAHSAVTAVGGHRAGFTGPCLPKEAWKETVGRGCQLRCHPVTSCVLPAQVGASRACRRWAWGFRVPSSQQTAQPQWTRPACWASGLGADVSTCPGREDPGGGGSPRSQFWVGEADPWSSPFSLPAPTPALSWPQVCRILLLASCQGRC